MIKIISTAFTTNGPVPKKYTCDGENINPPLTIDNIPQETKSLVLIVDDPDAPTGTWNHWLVWNIDPTTREIKEGSRLPNSIEGTNSSGKIGYEGPCPPSGTHRYFFKVYALSTQLNLATGAKRKDLEKAFENHIIDQGELIGTYSH